MAFARTPLGDQRSAARKSAAGAHDLQPIAAPLQPPSRRYGAALTGLWVALIAAAVVFIYPLWPAAVYQWQQLHSGSQSTAQLDAEIERAAANARVANVAATTAAAYDQTPIAGNQLIIPAIGVNTPIVEGSSLKVLDKSEGVWHQTGNLTKGNLVLAGHRFRYLPPNTSTLYSLNKLKPGDLMAVDWLGHRTVYRVNKVEVVPATDVALLNPTPQPQLTVYSCNDVLMTHRVVAIGTPLPSP